MAPFVIILLLLTSCQNSNSESPIESPAIETCLEEVHEVVELDYDSLKKSMDAVRLDFATKVTADRGGTITAARNYLYETLFYEMLPAWIGTVWDFNGVSETPGEGLIACGYYVTTTLKHSGFKLNRYKVAQQAAAVITKTLCQGGDITWFKYEELESLKTHLSARPNSVYVVGLDYHVGYIVTEGDEIYFMHSSFVDPGVVVKEKIDDSPVFGSTERWIIGDVLASDENILAWIKGTTFTIIN